MSSALRRTVAQPGVRARVEDIAGQSVDTWITVIRAADGSLSVVLPPAQVPTDGVHLLEWGIHRLQCGGCHDCVQA